MEASKRSKAMVIIATLAITRSITKMLFFEEVPNFSDPSLYLLITGVIITLVWMVFGGKLKKN